MLIIWYNLFHLALICVIFLSVIVDYHDDKSASTGDFTLLYEYELPDSPRRVRRRQQEEERQQMAKVMEEIVRGILDEAITRVNVSPPPENEVDVSKEVEESFDPYRQQLLANILWARKCAK